MSMRRIRLWDNACWLIGRIELKNFVKVMPRDFKRVLQAIADAEARPARDVDTAIMAAANA